MEVTQVKKQIQSKQIDSFYVFTGEEIEAQRIYINKISEVTNKPIKRIEKVTDAFNRRASILKVSNVFVCRDDIDFWRSATDFETLSGLLGDNILILQMTDIDKRSKSYKTYSNQIVEFHHMDADVLYKYVQKEVKLSDDNTYKLIAMCENDYARILLETDKIKHFALAESGLTSNEAFESLVKDGAITRPPKDAIFDYVNAMLRADIGAAFSYLEECKAIGEAPLRIVTVLYSNFKRVLQYLACESRDVCEESGLSSFDVKLAKQTADAWKGEDLLFFLQTLQSIEQRLKTGELEEGIVLDYLMVSLL